MRNESEVVGRNRGPFWLALRGTTAQIIHFFDERFEEEHVGHAGLDDTPARDRRVQIGFCHVPHKAGAAARAEERGWLLAYYNLFASWDESLVDDLVVSSGRVRAKIRFRWSNPKVP